MAYYDALISAWNGATQPPAGATGTAITAGMTTQQKCDAVNSWMVAGPDRKVPIAEAVNYLRINNLWLQIKASAGSTPAAAAAVDLVGDLRQDTVDFNLPVVQQMLAALVSASLLTQAQADALVALKSTQVLWWQANGYAAPGIGLGDAINAGLAS